MEAKYSIADTINNSNSIFFNTYDSIKLEMMMIILSISPDIPIHRLSILFFPSIILTILTNSKKNFKIIIQLLNLFLILQLYLL